MHAGGPIRAWLRGFVGLSIVGCLSVVPGCLIICTPSFPDPGGTAAKGLCMCAICLDKPFCMDEAMTTTKVDDGTCEGDPTHPLMAMETSSVAGPANRSTPFFCIPDADKNLDNLPLGCPAEPSQAAPIGNVNPCIDLPVNCIDPAIVTSVCGKMPDPSEPGCPEGANTGSERTTCAPGTQNELGYLGACDELITECSIWGKDVPRGDKAQRFCFLSCLDFAFSGHEPGTTCQYESDGIPYTCYQSCDPSKE